jgi:hypothetical protein
MSDETKERDQRRDESRHRPLEAARRAHADHSAHDGSEIEAASMDDRLLQDIGMAPQMPQE